MAPRTPLACALLVGAAACAAPAGGGVADPLEPLNRGVFVFNGVFDLAILRPLTWVYRRVLPAPVRGAVSNVLHNLLSIDTILNDVLQGELAQAGQDFGRFAVNSTIGVGGLFDVAGRYGVAQHDTDFGETLHRWGAGPGPYLVVPFVGPSTARDVAGLGVTFATYPIVYVDDTTVQLVTLGLVGVDRRARVPPKAEQMVRDSHDRYAFVRDAWYQNRRFHLEGEEADSESSEELEDLLDELDELEATGDVDEDP